MKWYQKIIYRTICILLMPYFFIEGYRYRYYRPKSKNFLFLSNHNTDLDFIRCGLAISTAMHFVASEHIFRLGFATKIIKFLFDPIPRPKGASGLDSARDIFKRLKKGQCVAMFAEGNRSFSGETGWLYPSTAKLLKISGAGLVTFAIHGGYMLTPRWSSSKRKGRTWASVVHEYSPEEISKLSVEEIYKIIVNDLHVDAYKDQKEHMFKYLSDKSAENLETALFVCPHCKKIQSIETSGSTVRCKECGLELKYNEFGFLENKTPDKTAYDTILQWYNWQNGFFKQYFENFKDENNPIFTDYDIELLNIGDSSNIKIKGVLSLYKSYLKFNDLVFKLEDISYIDVIQMDRLMFSLKDGSYYQLTSQTPYNAVKYMIAIKKDNK